MNKMMNLQDVFLNQARKEKILVTIILMNGFQFKGIVKGWNATENRIWCISTPSPH